MADRYWLCGDDCTTDCGACKGAGRPATVPDPREHPQRACPGGPFHCTCPDPKPLLAAEREVALAPVRRLIETAPVMWHGDYPVKAVPVSDLLSALASPAPASHAEEELR